MRKFLGVIVGGIAGFFAGLMLSPKTGKENREDLKNNAQKAKVFVEQKVEEIKKDPRTQEVATKISQKVVEVKDQIEKKSEEIKI